MRIVSGLYRGRRIEFPSHIRPTQDKVRQAVFDTLAGVVRGARVLDLYAGSGAMGLEALSRGAREAVFIEKDKRVFAALLRNIEAAGAGGQAEAFLKNAGLALLILAKKRRLFDCILADPPYHKGLAKKTLQTLGAGGILAPHGFVVIEHGRQEPLPEGEGVLRLFRQGRFGMIRVSFYQKAVRPGAKEA
ncbi:MAG: 16S rRNA (guanine(966)-N(2))-methyltransferase RsmD [Deltaproteobacteria bacterium]